MGTKTELLTCSWARTDELEIKIRDMNKNTIFRVVVNLNRPDKIAEAFEILGKFDVDLEKVLEEIKDKKKLKKPSFFDY